MILTYYYGENMDEFEFETDCRDYLNLFSKKELVQLVSEMDNLEKYLDIDKVAEFYTESAESEYGDMLRGEEETE